ncbi:hypothetical protein ACPF04_06365 [Campylobacter sp. MOP51]|uniref:hypothetical protein n=1 Tax=Campylobacter canis TaxID=3378588 RepID=UPI003C46E9D9
MRIKSELLFGLGGTLIICLFLFILTSVFIEKRNEKMQSFLTPLYADLTKTLPNYHSDTNLICKTYREGLFQAKSVCDVKNVSLGDGVSNKLVKSQYVALEFSSNVFNRHDKNIGRVDAKIKVHGLSLDGFKHLFEEADATSIKILEKSVFTYLSNNNVELHIQTLGNPVNPDVVLGLQIRNELLDIDFNMDTALEGVGKMPDLIVRRASLCSRVHDREKLYDTIHAIYSTYGNSISVANKVFFDIDSEQYITRDKFAQTFIDAMKRVTAQEDDDAALMLSFLESKEATGLCVNFDLKNPNDPYKASMFTSIENSPEQWNPVVDRFFKMSSTLIFK